MSTYTPKLSEIEQNWHIANADGQTLGRFASDIAKVLQGKHKPGYVKFLDTGDYVVVVNCDKLKVTGNKLAGKQYYRHTGYPGGIKSANLEQMMAKDSTKVLQLAVKGMLPRGPLGRKMLLKLKLFSGAEHQHHAQQPQALNFNSKRGE